MATSASARLESVAIPRYWRIIDEIGEQHEQARICAITGSYFMKPHEIEEPGASAAGWIVLYLDPAFSGLAAILPYSRAAAGVAQLDWVMHYATTLLAPGWRFQHSERQIPGAAPAGCDRHASPCTGRKRARYSPSTISATMAKPRHIASSGKIRLCR